MPFNLTDKPFMHPFTKQVIQPGQYYEGAAHQGSEERHDEKAIAEMTKQAKKEERQEKRNRELTEEEILAKEIEAAEKARAQFPDNAGQDDDEPQGDEDEKTEKSGQTKE